MKKSNQPQKYLADLGIIVLLMVMTIAYFGKVIFPNFSEPYSFIGDFLRASYPARFYTIREILSGQLPLWNPYSGCGGPFIADMETAIFYPLNLLLLFFAPEGHLSYLTLEYQLIFHYFLAGLFMYFFMKNQSVARVSALLAAVCFMFSGFLWAHASHVNIIEGAIWLPLIFLFLQKSIEKKSPQPAIIAGIILSLSILAGHPQIPFFVILALAFYLFYQLFLPKKDQKGLKNIFYLGKSLGLILLVGFGVAAVQLIPTYELLGAIKRLEPPYGYIVNYSLHPSKVISFLTPFFHNSTNIDENHGYMGILPLFLSIISIYHLHRKRVYYFLLLGIGAILLAFGRYNPFYNVLYQYVPGFQIFRAPARFIYLFNFAIAVLSGFGCDVLINALRSKSRVNTKISKWIWLSMGAVISWLIILTLLIKYHLITNNQVALIKISYLYLTIFSSILGLTVIYFATKKWIGINWFRFILFSVLLTEIFFFNRYMAWNKQHPDIYWVPNEKVKFLQSKNPVFRIKNEGIILGMGNWNEANIGQVFKIPTYKIYSSLDLTGIYSGSGSITALGKLLLSSNKNPQLLDLLNIKHMVSTEDLTREYNGKYNKFDLWPGRKREIDLKHIYDKPTKEINIISHLSDSVEIPNNVVVSLLTIIDRSGEKYFYRIRAGEDTSEWSYDRPDVLGKIKHDKAKIYSSRPASTEGYQGYNYISKFIFNQPIIPSKIIISYLYDKGAINIEKILLNEIDIFTLGKRYKKVFNDIYENIYALPKAFIVHKALAAKTSEAIAKDLEVLNPEEEVILEKGVFLPLSEGGKGEKNNKVAVTRYSPKEIQLEVFLKKGGYLVLSEIFYPGWKAFIDGIETKIYRANYILRALAVKEGSHRVRFVYDPLSFKIGIAISLLTLTFLMIFLIFSRWVKKR